MSLARPPARASARAPSVRPLASWKSPRNRGSDPGPLESSSGAAPAPPHARRPLGAPARHVRPPARVAPPRLSPSRSRENRGGRPAGVCCETVPPVRVLALGLLAALCVAFPARAHDYWLEFSPLSPAAGRARAQPVGRRGLRGRGPEGDGAPAPGLAAAGHRPGRARPAGAGARRDHAVPRPAARRRRRLPVRPRARGVAHRAEAAQVQPLPPPRGPGRRPRRAQAGRRAPAARARALHPLPQELRAGRRRDRRRLDPRPRPPPRARPRPRPRRPAPRRPPRRPARFAGEPLAGARVEAFTRGREGRVAAQAATTDADGRVTFTVSAAGPWLLRAVHMQRCAGCKDADWDSSWSSYGFAVR
ncbi:DUF4198 domain-containing protein [Nannocystis pusilla]|uniref:DUF4198 domain-containing protein n=1 Tax=Nannocystis pusilla TaxID=889268 RepID=A0A9X3F2I7_9BACT|nr:DUF4198 domain-containing protein [Nannocystis pusilla]MCY1010206.1 DUF4198 domain-containing protein [Nannocystis pusilla]